MGEWPLSGGRPTFYLCYKDLLHVESPCVSVRVGGVSVGSSVGCRQVNVAAQTNNRCRVLYSTEYIKNFEVKLVGGHYWCYD